MSLFALLCALLEPAHAKRPKPVDVEAPVAPAPVEAASPVQPVEPAKFEVPRFEKTTLPGCGCAAYLPTGAVVDPVTASEDGSQVWTAEQMVGGQTYGVIAVKLSFTADSPEVAEEVLVAYLEFLKAQFGITESAGVGRGHTMEGSPARGVIDFWKGADGEHWAVKGWSTVDRLGVMMVRGPAEHPNHNVVQVFQNGFRFE
jgi:hypothetical protein